jgi:hypothetical protein
MSTMEARAHFRADQTQMTPRPEIHARRDADAPSSRGWVLFAGSYLLLVGALNGIWGITALSKQQHFVEGGLVWSDLNTWGWVALIVAAVQLLVGVLLLLRRTAGVLMAIVVSMFAVMLNFLTLGAHPGWSAVALVGNALVLWAVTVHSDAFERGH